MKLTFTTFTKQKCKGAVLMLMLGASTIFNSSAQQSQVSTYSKNPDGVFIPGAVTFYNPIDLTGDRKGNLYVANFSANNILKIDTSGAVSIYSGSGAQGHNDGPGSLASFSWMTGICIDSIGNLYVAERYNNDIRMITPNGTVSTYAGSRVQGFIDGPKATAQFNQPVSVFMDKSGTLYVSEWGNNSIRKISKNGMVSTFVGGSQGSQDGIGTAAQFMYPTKMCQDAFGNLYVVDWGNNMIRMITPGGIVSTFAGSTTPGSINATGSLAGFNNPFGICIDGLNNLYVSEYGAQQDIRKITPAGVTTTLVGGSTSGYRDDIGANAQFNQPHGLYIDSAGSIFVADMQNGAIRKISGGSLTASAPQPNYGALSTTICQGSTVNFSPSVTGG